MVHKVLFGSNFHSEAISIQPIFSNSSTFKEFKPWSNNVSPQGGAYHRMSFCLLSAGTPDVSFAFCNLFLNYSALFSYSKQASPPCTHEWCPSTGHCSFHSVVPEQQVEQCCCHRWTVNIFRTQLLLLLGGRPCSTLPTRGHWIPLAH